MLKREELENLVKSIKGKIRGVVFQTDATYVLSKEGEEGLKKLEKRVKELGLPINYREAKAMEWQPVGLRIVSILLIKDTFGWSEEEIRNMGKAAPKTSFIVKFFFKLFLAIEKFAKEIPSYWREHYTEGELKVVKLDTKEKKKMILHLENYKLHPLFCKYLEGYFETVLNLAQKGEAEVKETKCMHKDDTSYHEFTAIWK